MPARGRSGFCELLRRGSRGRSRSAPPCPVGMPRSSLAASLPEPTIQPMLDPTPCAWAASMMRSASRPLVVGLLLRPIPGHDQHDPERRPCKVPRVAIDRGEGAQRVPLPDHHDLPRLLLDALPDQRATSRTSSTTSCGTGSGGKSGRRAGCARKRYGLPAVLSSVVSLMVSPLRLGVSRALFRALPLPPHAAASVGERSWEPRISLYSSLLFQELFVGAAGRDAALVEDQDQVSVPHRRNPLGDDEDRAVPLAHEPVQGLLDGRLRLGVHGRGAVVQDQEPRVDEERPGYGDALALPAGEPDAPLADDGVVAVGEPPDKPVGLGRLGRGHDLFVGRVWLAEGDVVPARYPRRGASPAGLSRSGTAAMRASRRARRGRRALRPLGNVVEARDEVDERGLARARGPKDGDRLSRPGFETKPRRTPRVRCQGSGKRPRRTRPGRRRAVGGRRRGRP